MLTDRLSPIILFILLMSCVVVTFAQPDKKAEALAEMRVGNYKKAAEWLRVAVASDKNDDEAWFLLGQSYLKLDDGKNALTALQSAAAIKPERGTYRSLLAFAYLAAGDKRAETEATEALRIEPDNALGNYVLGILMFKDAQNEKAYEHADRAIRAKLDIPNLYRLRGEAAIGIAMDPTDQDISAARRMELLNTAEADLEKYMGLDISSRDRKQADAALRSARSYAKFIEENKNELPNGAAAGSDIEGKLVNIKILKKPFPHYTNYARANMISGTVVLLVTFRANGEIGPVYLVRSLETSLDMQAIDAAKGIKFKPASRNGVPVTITKKIEYTFEIG